MQAEPAIDSTRGPALPYAAGMRSSTILIPLLFILADGVRCKDDAPAGSEFGEPCGKGSGPVDAELSCASGLECYIGYCEEKWFSCCSRGRPDRLNRGTGGHRRRREGTHVAGEVGHAGER